MLNRRSFCAAVAALFSPLSSVFAAKTPVEPHIVGGFRELAEHAIGQEEFTKALVYKDDEVIGCVTNVRWEENWNS